jgi:hypothetical protein
MRRLFVAQELLDQWAEQGKIELSGNELKILAEDRTFQLHAGARFLSLAAGQDTNKLVGKVKSDEQLQSLGGELYMNSVLVGEDAYDVQAGFLAEVADLPGAPPNGPPNGPPTVPIEDRVVRSAPTERVDSKIDLTAVASPLAPSKQDDEKAALAKFLLENLT